MFEAQHLRIFQPSPHGVRDDGAFGTVPTANRLIVSEVQPGATQCSLPVPAHHLLPERMSSRYSSAQHGDACDDKQALSVVVLRMG